KRYLIVRRLGGGETSAVYEAIDMNTRASVALKQVIVGAEAASADREIFEREMRLLAGLRHPALPTVSDSFVEGDSLFLVSVFVAGDDLLTMMERNGRPFPEVQALRWAEQLLDALDYMHSQLPPLLHRDITPRNLKLTPRGQIMLIDYGLSRSEASPAQSKPAGAGMASPFQFLPPEQVAGTGATVRSDLFGLSATLYCLLTVTVPVVAGKRANAIARGQPDPLRPAREIIPDLPVAVSDLLTRGLALDPAARWASAAEMRSALDRARAAPLVWPELPSERPAELVPTIQTSPAGARPADAPTIPVIPPGADSPIVSVPGQSESRQRWLAPAIGVAMLLALLLAFVLLRDSGEATGVTPTAPAASGGLAADAAT